MCRKNPDFYQIIDKRMKKLANSLTFFYVFFFTVKDFLTFSGVTL